MANLLSQASQEGISGILEFRHGKKKIELLIENGQVRLHSVDGQKALRIGEILLQRERITVVELNDALKEQKTNRTRLGEILQTMGVITAEEVDRAIQIQVEEELFELFAWQEGDFDFTEGAPADKSWSNMTFEAEKLVEDSIGRLKQWREVTRQIRDDREIFILEREGRDEFLEGLIDGLERDILSELTGEQDIHDIVNRLLVPRFKIYRILGQYLASGRIRRPTLEELKTGGIFMIQERKPKVALKLLERAFDLYPGDSDVVEALATTLEDLTEKRRAAAFFKILASRYMEGGDEEKGLDFCRKIGELQPNDAYAFEKLYEAARSKSDKKELIASGRSLVKIYHSRREFDKAVRVGLEVLELAPGDIPLRQKIINIHLEAGKLEAAVADFEALEGVIISNESLAEEDKDKELFRLYDKILRLDANRKDIRSKLEAVRLRLPMEQAKIPKKRFVTLPKVLITLGVLAALAVGGLYLYQQSADAGFKEIEGKVAGMIEKGEIAQAAELFGEFAMSRPWTEASEKAHMRQQQLQQLLLDQQMAQKKREQVALAKIAEGNEALSRGELSSARDIFEEVKETYKGVIILTRAEDGIRRVKRKIEEDAQDAAESKRKEFNQLMDQAKSCNTDEKGSKILFVGLSYLDRARAELDAIDNIGATGWDKFTQRGRGSIASILTSIETKLQGLYAKRGIAEWSNRNGDIVKARDVLDKARVLERDPDVHKKVMTALREMDGYEDEARALQSEVMRIVEDVK
ncbi:MAG: DUF4388 domain-containing protein, partial [Planctomycetota bacterium]